MHPQWWGIGDVSALYSTRPGWLVVVSAQVEYLASLNVAVTKERKRQILADILVWAEVTQQHYDTTTRRCVYGLWRRGGGPPVLLLPSRARSCIRARAHDNAASCWSPTSTTSPS